MSLTIRLSRFTRLASTFFVEGAGADWSLFRTTRSAALKMLRSMRLRREKSFVQTTILTVMALVAFATNSLLCRFALGEAQVDAASFTSLRLLSGALTLWVIALMSGRSNGRGQAGSWGSAAMLFLYAVAFSFAYLTLDAGTGALILFGSVQATMILAGFIEGHRPQALEWIGMLCASCGLIYLILLPDLDITARGAWLAVLSGALASGLGYVVWYAARKDLTTTRAAIIQLAVPVLAASGGVLFLI
jgi:drug/metabolite transporter (DMT)-like permease